MDPTYWYKQSGNDPLFPDLLWSKPENKKTAGKLLILGGNSHNLMAPGIAFAAAIKAGVGTARVLLPDAVRKAIGNSFEEGEFAFSTPSGSFAKTAINQILENLDWADGLLLAGDFGRNSETAILLEQILDKYDGPATLSQDSLDYFINNVGKITNRENTVMVTNLTRLQKMTRAGMPSLIIQHKMSLQALVGLLNSWSRESKLKILTYHNGNYIYAENGQVSTTAAKEREGWEVPLAAYLATWRLQQPEKSFEAASSAIFEYVKK
jgi:ADP-dependent NAD(P)H-hydrate dehydratase / NAD(P)H-hydrate epimerase